MAPLCASRLIRPPFSQWLRPLSILENRMTEETSLTVLEASTLQQHEAVIQRGLKTFADVGNSLLAIRDGRLYRAKYPTFEAYCRERWGFNASRARQLIGAASVMDNLKSVTVVTLPANEAQTRPLAQLPPAEQPEAWKAANNTAKQAGRTVTAADVQAEVESRKPHVAHNSGDNEWYTPALYVEAARAVMGKIELDPASTPEANKVVKAENIHTAKDDGLQQDWTGKLWMNPPYETALVGKFIEKLATSVESGAVPEALVLVNNATETKWFVRLAGVSAFLCFLTGRVKFWQPGNHDSATGLQGQAVAYIGKHGKRFTEHFKQFGIVVEIIR